MLFRKSSGRSRLKVFHTEAKAAVRLKSQPHLSPGCLVRLDGLLEGPVSHSGVFY